ncbi:MAG: hypothetical protein H0W08_03340 [Acidobacteria bacterium]|nr:hypothetical protein [Acidobacteriota bacterium]
MGKARGQALDLKSGILDRIRAQPGRVWTAVDCLDLGPRAAVDKALQRLATENTIDRIVRGLYFLPSHNALTGGQTVPHQAAIIDAVARRDQVRVVIDGLTAANDLGLTTAVPARVTVLTDARLRPITLGRQVIRFRAAAPSRLHWAGRPAMRIVQALYWLQDTLDIDRQRIIAQLRRILEDPRHGDVMRSDLRQGLPTLPIWMQSVVREVFETTTKSRRGQRRPPQRATHRQSSTGS